MAKSVSDLMHPSAVSAATSAPREPNLQVAPAGSADKPVAWVPPALAPNSGTQRVRCRYALARAPPHHASRGGFGLRLGHRAPYGAGNDDSGQVQMNRAKGGQGQLYVNFLARCLSIAPSGWAGWLAGWLAGRPRGCAGARASTTASGRADLSLEVCWSRSFVHGVPQHADVAPDADGPPCNGHSPGACMRRCRLPELTSCMHTALLLLRSQSSASNFVR